MGLLCSLGHRATTQCAHALRWHWDLVGFVLVNLWCSGHWYVDHCLSLFFWQFYCLSFNLRLLITTLVSSDYHFGIFWLPLWFLLITPMISSDYHSGFFWLPLWYLLITTLVSSNFSYEASFGESSINDINKICVIVYLYLRYTVKPVYKGHSMEPENVPFMESFPLYTG